MSCYRLLFKSSAQKEFAKLDYPMQRHMKMKLEMLAKEYNSVSHKIKKLNGLDNLFRFRVADYRVVFQKNDDVLQILIVRIGHRKEVYKNLN